MADEMYTDQWGCYDCNTGDTKLSSLKTTEDDQVHCPNCESTSLYYPVNFSVEGLVDLWEEGKKTIRLKLSEEEAVAIHKELSCKMDQLYKNWKETQRLISVQNEPADNEMYIERMESLDTRINQLDNVTYNLGLLIAGEGDV